MAEQKIIMVKKNFVEIDKYLYQLHIKKLLLVCGRSIKNLKYDLYFNEINKSLGVEVVRFNDFEPNPKYESVVKGVELFNKEKCDAVVAVGGGSAMDVAKCIKFFSNMYLDKTVYQKSYLEKEIVPNNIPFLTIPTTAGTGSETTSFAVIYFRGEKKSIADASGISDMVVIDGMVLDSLPLYQKKATMMDALCHAVESYWSVNSTDESKHYSQQALKLILSNMDSYIKGEVKPLVMDVIDDVNIKECIDDVNELMLYASHLAGKAINITKTTAGHAMSYKLTTLYGLSHGHAVALCIAKLFRYMVHHTKQCCDIRGEEYVKDMFLELSHILGFNNVDDASGYFELLVEWLEFKIPFVTEDDFSVLASSVDVERLKNNPIKLNYENIYNLYHEILNR